jgi:2-C-methyl-D-erythritol 2,4-cyclodiphosphate synthase
MNIRIGHGVDFHQLKNGLPLILGGIKVQSSKGIIAHSDGDIVIHAIVDSILGALALGDIGTYFPSSDSKLKNQSSHIFLEKTITKMKNKNYTIANIDVNIILQSPHINPYILRIRKQLSIFMNLDIEKISIKATTTDKLGYIGKHEGVMTTATTLLIKE